MVIVSFVKIILLRRGLNQTIKVFIEKKAYLSVVLSDLVNINRITAEGLPSITKRFLYFFVKNSHFYAI